MNDMEIHKVVSYCQKKVVGFGYDCREVELVYDTDSLKEVPLWHKKANPHIHKYGGQ